MLTLKQFLINLQFILKDVLLITMLLEWNKKAQLSLTNPRDAFWGIVVYGVGVFVCVNV